MIKRWLVGLLIAGLLAAKPLPIACLRLTRQHRSSNIFKNSIGRYQNSSAPRKTPPLKPRRSPSKILPKPMRTCRNRPRSMSRGGTMLSYPLSMSLFQSLCIPLLPMFATLISLTSFQV